MKYLSGEKDIVFVGLNPTEKAVKYNAVFSVTKRFWTILHDAGIIMDFPSDLKKCADEIFNNGKHTKLRLGFADLVPENTSQFAKGVKPQKYHVENLIKDIEKASASKVVLMGHDVAKAFVEHLGLNKEWERLSNKKHEYRTKNGEISTCIDYGKLCNHKYPTSRKKFELFVMPFPETVPIPQKEDFYKKLL